VRAYPGFEIQREKIKEIIAFRTEISLRFLYKLYYNTISSPPFRAWYPVSHISYSEILLLIDIQADFATIELFRLLTRHGLLTFVV
jgi:hypothetical protein